MYSVFQTISLSIQFDALLVLYSFPTRRSSDLRFSRVQLLQSCDLLGGFGFYKRSTPAGSLPFLASRTESRFEGQLAEDRKSTRLNSSHRTISYAVFCLKKKSCCIVNTAVLGTC